MSGTAEEKEELGYLDSKESFLASVPNCSFEQALSIAGVEDARELLQCAEEVVKRAEEKGVVKELGITHDEALCIAGYTIETIHTTPMYRVLNTALCGDLDESTLSRIGPLMLLLLRALRKLPRVEKPVVYRLLANPDFKKDEVKILRGFNSVSLNRKLIDSIALSGSGIMTVEGPCLGYELRELSQFPEENEFVLEPETHIRVVEVVCPETEYGRKLIKCILEPSKPVLETLAPFKS